MAQKYQMPMVSVEKKTINVKHAGCNAQLEQQPDNMLYIQEMPIDRHTWFCTGEVDVIHFNFPIPGRKSAPISACNHTFIARYTHSKPDGEIRMKNGLNSALLNHSLMEFQEEGWRLKEVSVNDYRTPGVCRGCHQRNTNGVFLERRRSIGRFCERTVLRKDALLRNRIE